MSCCENNKLSADVIIIGAGIAGIKTAIELTKSGISCLILESRDRLGGRLNTVNLKSGTPIDLGASWFHDCLINPLLEENWKSGRINFAFDDSNMSMFNENGRLNVEKLNLLPIFNEIKIYLKNLFDELSPENDIPLKLAILNYLKSKKYLLTHDQIKNIPQLVRYFELWIGSSWEILSARNISYDEHFGRDALVLNGYEKVFNNELNKLSNFEKLFKIEKNNIVYKIKYFKNKIYVYTKSAKGLKLNTFSSNYLVFTPPLSILKSNDLNILGSIKWEPPLPNNFTNCLNKISFSNLGKVFFEFNKVFWNLNDDRFLSFANIDKLFLKSSIDDSFDLNINSTKNKNFSKLDTQIPTNGPIPNGTNFTILFINLAKFTNKPIILALISSPLTQYIEFHSKNQKLIFNVFEPVFKRITNLSEIPLPTEIRTTEWSHDPFSRGSYTGVTVNDNYDECLNYLLNPNDIFNGKVRFAGEGTVDEGNGCAHGAWLSGKREADKIKSLINKSKF